MIKQLAFCICVTAMLSISNIAVAQSTFDGGGDGTTWEDAANWNPDGLPSGPIPAGNANIGDGFFDVTLGSNQMIGEFDLSGDQTDGDSSIDHSAGTLTGANWIKIGGQGSTGSGSLTGTYDLNGDAVVTGFSRLQVGFNTGTGNLIIRDDASMTITEQVALAAGQTEVFDVGNNSTANLTVSDNGAFNVGNLSMGGVNSTATVNQTGGSVTSSTWIAIANFSDPTGTAVYNISAGTAEAMDGNFGIGQEGDGTLNVSGTANIQQSVNVQAADSIFIGQNGGSVGKLNITGSQATISGVDFRMARDEGSTATVCWIADANGITTIESADNTEFLAGTSNLALDLSADPQSSIVGTQYVLIDNNAAVEGTFTDLAEGATVSFTGGTGSGTISYMGGPDGFDIVLTVTAPACLPGDVNMDGSVDLLDVDPFVAAITIGKFSCEADVNQDGAVDLLDVQPFIAILTGG